MGEIMATPSKVRCAHCRRTFIWNGQGRRKRYCRQACRQRAYEKRPVALPQSFRRLAERMEAELKAFDRQWKPLKTIFDSLHKARQGKDALVFQAFLHAWQTLRNAQIRDVLPDVILGLQPYDGASRQ
jgi:hypothetical protein